jgi:hypothetical protein
VTAIQENGRPSNAETPNRHDLGKKSTTNSTVTRTAVKTAERVEGLPWGEGAMLLIEQLAKSGRRFTAADVVSRLGEPEHYTHVGALFAAAKINGLIEVVGFRESDRRGTSQIIREWRGRAR